MKKILCFLLALMMTLTAAPVFAANAYTYTYYCEDGIVAEVNTYAKILTLSGEGDMMDYAEGNRPPWYEKKSQYTKVIIENGITSIGNYAFADNLVLVSAEIPESVTRVGDYAFRKCIKLTDMHFSDNVKEIGIYALADCNALKRVTLPKVLPEIPQALFRCSYYIESIVMPEDCPVIGAQAFLSCSYMKSIELPENLKSIGIYAFNGCNALTSITIPEGTEFIGDFAFYSLSKLNEINIPKSVNYIGEDAFCSTPWFNALPDGINLVNGIAITYKGSVTSKTIEIPEGAEKISPAVCGQATYVTEVVIPDTVTTLCDYAFYNLTSLYSVTIPASVTEIGEYALGYSTSSAGGPVPMYPFTVYSAGSAAAKEYAEENQFDFVCLHKEGGYIDYPDCTVGGIATKVCEYCGEGIGEITVSAGSHSYGQTKIFDATCTENAYIKSTCKLCGYEKITVTAPANGHTADGGIKIREASCKEKGLIYKLCKDCGESFDEIEIEKLSHISSDVQTVIKAPTCAEDGEYSVLCANCDEVLETGVIPSEGHKMSSAYVTLAESNYRERIKGIYVRECSECGIVLKYGEFYRGDVNGDGRISSRDTMSLNKSMTNSGSGSMTAEQKAEIRFLGDMNGDNRVTSRDTLALKRLVSNTK